MAPDALRDNGPLFPRDTIHGGMMTMLFAAYGAHQFVFCSNRQRLDIFWSFLRLSQSSSTSFWNFMSNASYSGQ
jgi:hypothetical protein